MKSVVPRPELVAYVDDLKATMGRHTHLDPVEMLAGASHLVGSLIALQDQRKLTPAAAMELVARNIESGNADAIASTLADTKGTA